MSPHLGHMHDNRTMTLARALRVLDVDVAADRSEIKQAYWDLVRVWHPDRFAADARLSEKAAWKLSEINAAYHLLQARRRQSAPAVERPAPVSRGRRPGRVTAPVHRVPVQSLPDKSRRERAVRIVAAVATLSVATACVLVSLAPQRTPAPVASAPERIRSLTASPRVDRPIPVTSTRTVAAERSMVTPAERVKSPFSRDLDLALVRSQVQPAPLLPAADVGFVGTATALDTPRAREARVAAP